MSIRIVVLSLFCMLTLLSSAYQLKGIVLNPKGMPIAYANVFVSKEGTLLSSALTDTSGRFTFDLEPGLYHIEASYLGYKSLVQELELNKDFELVFKLETDLITHIRELVSEPEPVYLDTESKDRIKIPLAARRDDAMADEAVFMTLAKPGLPNSNGETGVAGKLTAGEINDFSKWEFWQDLSEGELSAYKQAWNFEVTGRYPVQVRNQNGLPVPALVVKLLADGKVLFQAVTDNTGKAELWASLEGMEHDEQMKIILEHNGSLSEINDPVQAGQGENAFNIQYQCDPLNTVEIAFVVDATGSMGDELEFLKAELSDIMLKTNQFDKGVNYRFANVFYRDFGDEYLTRTQDFNNVFSVSSAFINAQSAGGGGDFEEAVDVALDTAINTLSWSNNARARILFLVLDAPPHENPEIKKKLLQLSSMAANKGIRIVPIVASGLNKSAEYLLRSIALATNGTYLFLTDDSGIGNEHLKPSTDEYQVELLSELLKKVIIRYTYIPDCEQQLPELPWTMDEDSIQVNLPKDSLTMEPEDSVNSELVINWTYFPNPTQGLVYITASHHISELHVTDLNGKLLQRVTNIHPEAQVKVDLSSYASGIYLLRIPLGKQWVSGKIILTH